MAPATLKLASVAVLLLLFLAVTTAEPQTNHAGEHATNDTAKPDWDKCPCDHEGLSQVVVDACRELLLSDYVQEYHLHQCCPTVQKLRPECFCETIKRVVKKLMCDPKVKDGKYFGYLKERLEKIAFICNCMHVQQCNFDVAHALSQAEGGA